MVIPSPLSRRPLSSGVALHQPVLFILVASWWGRIVYRTGLNGTTSSSPALDYTLDCAVGFAAWLEVQQTPGLLRVPASQTEARPLTTAPLAVASLALMWSGGLLSKAGSGQASQARCGFGRPPRADRHRCTGSCQTSWIWMGRWYELISLYVEGTGQGGGTYGH